MASYINLENLSSGDAFNMLDSITDEQAFDSECGGDSDAEDDFVIHTRSDSRSTDKITVRKYASPSSSIASLDDFAGCSTSQARSSQVEMSSSQTEQDNVDEDFDSDDSVADPNYLSNPKDHLQPSSSSTDSSGDEEEAELPDFEYNFTRSRYSNQRYRSFNFEETCGPSFDPGDENPLSFLRNFLSDDILENIVLESNRYASQNGKELNLSVTELQAFIGVLIIMGFHELPAMKMYWSSNKNFRVDRIANVFTQRRFLFILRYLHLNDNSKMPDRKASNFDRLYKLRPLIDHLNEKFSSSFDPSRNLAVDESMVRFKGRSVLKQYMPMKPIKRGFKIWVIADSSTGYMLNFKIYEGKESQPGDVRKCNPNREDTLGEKTVLELTRNFYNRGYCVFFDNFFTTFDLLTCLLGKNTFSCGTLRENRKHYPKELLHPDKKMKMGDSDYASSGDISVCKWKDRGKKSVIVASSFQDPAVMTTVTRTNKQGRKESVECPAPIKDYNENMGGVDRFDQNLSYYNISWKSRRWWMRVFYYLLDACFVNSYVCYRIYMQQAKKKPVSHLSFRSMLADELLRGYCSRKRPGPGPKLLVTSNKMLKPSGRSVGIDTSVRINNVGVHLPIKGTIRRCARCSTRAKPVRSTISCEECGVALCLECFAPFHKL